MREKIAAIVVSFIFTVFIPALVSAMNPSISLGVGVPAFGASVLTGITVLVWRSAQHQTTAWRRKLLPIFVMLAGGVIYISGGYWYYKSHTPDKPSNSASASISKLKPLNMWQLFETDFPGVGMTRMTQAVSIAGNTPQEFQFAIFWDIPTNSYFFAMYFHAEANLFAMVVGMAQAVQQLIQILSQFQFEVVTPGETRHISLDKMMFSHQVFLYVEDSFSINQMSDIENAYTSLGYVVDIRTEVYNVLHSKEFDRKPESEIPPKKIGETNIRLPKGVDGMKITITNKPVTAPLPSFINHSAPSHPSPAPPTPPTGTLPQTSP